MQKEGKVHLDALFLYSDVFDRLEDELRGDGLAQAVDVICAIDRH